MVSRYSTKMVVNRNEGGSTVDGVYQEGQTVEVYNGKVDFQDGVSSSNAMRLENMMGVDSKQVEGTVFIEETWKLKDFSLQDQGELTFEDGEQMRIEIIGIRRMDSILFVRIAG